MKIVPVVRKDKLKEIDFWNDLPEYVKAGIKRGQQQAAEGKLTPHDEVMKKYAKYQ
jgi:predicted transcriptional regulator